jgi:hypothetical protein
MYWSINLSCDVPPSLQVDVAPAEASTAGLAAELAMSGQAQGARVLCPVPHVTGWSAAGTAYSARSLMMSVNQSWM